MTDGGRFDELSKKEVSRLEKERKRLDKNLRGIQTMERLPTRFTSSTPSGKRLRYTKHVNCGIPVVGDRRHELRSRTKSTMSSPETTTL